MFANIVFIVCWSLSLCEFTFSKKADACVHERYPASSLSLGQVLLSVGRSRYRYNLDFVEEVPSLARAAWCLKTSASDREELEDLYSSLHSRIHYLSEDDKAAVRRAFKFSFLAHYGQKRHSGEPFITHPVEVAKILADDKVDSATLIAGLLHDVVEKSEPSLDEIEQEFGEDVKQLVGGVTEVSKVTSIANPEDKRAAKRAENLRSFIVAISNDMRVLVLKLAEYLHNLRTLEAVPKQTQKRVAKEALDIYAPLAQRFGLWHYKIGLSDLAFNYIYPEQNLFIQEYKYVLMQEHNHTLKDFCDDLRRIFSREWRWRDAELQVRTKDAYSIWRKMRKRKCEIWDINDILAVRVILDQDISHCYLLLSKLHSKWDPLPDSLKDYILSPKENNYQSLHTTLLVSQQPIEVQIRTRAMHDVAEYGVAAHWQYKDAASSAWLETLERSAKDKMNPEEFMELVRRNLNSRSVFVFEIDGSVHEIAKGTTVNKFLSDIGYDDDSHVVYVNGEYRGLTERLKNSDIIEFRRFEPGRPLAYGSVRHDSHIKTSFSYEQHRCQDCLPLPDDFVVGGNILHRVDCFCDTLGKSHDQTGWLLQSQPSGRGWGNCHNLPCKIVAFCQDRPGIIANIFDAVQAVGGEINDVRPRVLHPDEDAVIELTVSVDNKPQLQTLMRAADQVNGVARVLRGSFEQLSQENPSDFWKNCRVEPSSSASLGADHTYNKLEAHGFRNISH